MQAVDTWAPRFAGELSVYPKFTNFDETLAMTFDDAQQIVDMAKAANKKLVAA